MGAFLGWRADTARAQADAEHLRNLYGPDAEAWCADALASVPFGDPRRGEILRIVKALRALPAANGKGRARAARGWITGVWRRT
jgi:hypothetical protein